VTIWDRGSYDLEKWRDDEVIFTIHGEKHGSHRLALIQTGGKNWLLHLMKDQQPVDWDDPESVAASKARKAAGSASGSWKRVGAEPRRGLKRGKSVVGGRINAAGTVHPMLATLAELETFDRGDDWVYEMKWDGYRAIATVRDGTVELRSRNGLDFTPTYPELQALADAVTGDAVLDGEIVALDDAGRPSFSRLQTRSGITSPRDVERARKVQGVEFFAFDILERDGRSLVTRPYTERRDELRAAVQDVGVVRVPPDAGTDLDDAIATSRKLKLEGVIAKRASSPYRLGRRSRDWLKIKHTLTQEVVVAGWRPGNGARSDTVGSLLIGIPGDDGLAYVGRVGSGFSDRELTELRGRLDRIARETSPLVGVPPVDAKDARWVTPKLVGEVEYAEVTPDGRLRAPTWRGWRPDKSPDEITWEVPDGP
jgi:bifunctional non-homologous end joining protein LigD